MAGPGGGRQALAMINVDHLVKRYGGTTAVSEATFACEPGTITGFLGPNGAGKSTTLRMIAGLTRPDRGRRPSVGVRSRNGRIPLAIAPRTAALPLSRVDEALHGVGLGGPAADRRVGNYSLGMRQRLG